VGYPESGDFDDPLPPEIHDRVRGEVEPDEELLWVGRPGRNRYLLSSIPIVLFGIPWTAFSVFWVVMASGARAGGPMWGLFPLFGVPFVLIGLGMLSSPFRLSWQGRRVAYAVTNQRVILLEPRFTGGVRIISMSGDELTPLERVERHDGSGDVCFGEQYEYARGRNRPASTPRRFLGIPHVREVESLVRRTLLPKRSDAG
jgi:hypothetical protein